MEHTFDARYWDEIWRDGQGSALSAAPVNPHLVAEVGGLTPGTALDAGCGAGTEAIWLARSGWSVTGVDLAAAALAVAADRAVAGGVADRVDWQREDLTTWEPPTRYDLVASHYAHPAIPPLDFVERLGTWVAPGGILFIVGHLHDTHRHDEAHQHDEAQHAVRRRHGHEPGPEHRHGERPDPHRPPVEAHRPPVEATLTLAAITERLVAETWEVLTAEESHRTLTGPGLPPTPLHDVVVRARRRG